MNEYFIYKYLEFSISALYMTLIFLFVQIWFLWKDVDKNELALKSFVDESFFKKNCVYVFSFSIFFMIHEFLEGTRISDSMLYFEFIEMLAVISLVLFTYGWYRVLRKSAHKKSPLSVLSNLPR